MHEKRVPAGASGATMTPSVSTQSSRSIVLVLILALTTVRVYGQHVARPSRAVTIEYIAHACFRVISPAGKQVVIDPYASRVWLGYDFPPTIHADAVLFS